jgi:hypothetical protein
MAMAAYLDCLEISWFSEALTKLTKPTSEGVASVLSVILGSDEFDDRVDLTNCHH